MSATPILIEEGYWANSQLSIARYFGGLQFKGQEYLIVNKDGITVEELSNPLSEHYVGNEAMAIPPGEPADLVLKSWLPVYRKIGRDEFIRLIEKHVSLEAALKMINQK